MNCHCVSCKVVDFHFQKFFLETLFLWYSVCLSLKVIFTARQPSCGKVIFLVVCVCLFTQQPSPAQGPSPTPRAGSWSPVKKKGFNKKSSVKCSSATIWEILFNITRPIFHQKLYSNYISHCEEIIKIFRVQTTS